MFCPKPHPPLALLAAGIGCLLLASTPGRAETLYKLDTQCSLRQGRAVPCTVEATNEPGATVYRHRIGKVTELIRITDNPVRILLWNPGTKEWQNVSSAGARFSTNTVCFNARDLCVVNPNYLNSVREEWSESLSGRDLVKLHFAADGRLDASCYDDGCGVDLK